MIVWFGIELSLSDAFSSEFPQCSAGFRDAVEKYCASWFLLLWMRSSVFPRKLLSNTLYTWYLGISLYSALDGCIYNDWLNFFYLLSWILSKFLSNQFWKLVFWYVFVNCLLFSLSLFLSGSPIKWVLYFKTMSTFLFSISLYYFLGEFHNLSSYVWNSYLFLKMSTAFLISKRSSLFSISCLFVCFAWGISAQSSLQGLYVTVCWLWASL